MKRIKRLLSAVLVLSMIVTSQAFSTFAETVDTKKNSVAVENIDGEYDFDVASESEVNTDGDEEEIDTKDYESEPEIDDGHKLETEADSDKQSETTELESMSDESLDESVEESFDESVEESFDESVEESFDESVKESSAESSIENIESTDNLVEDIKETTNEIKDDETKDIVNGEIESVADIATDSEIDSNEIDLDIATGSEVSDKLLGEVVNYTVHFDRNLADYADFNTSEIDSWFDDQNVTSNENGSADIVMPGQRWKMIEKTSTPGISRKFMYWNEVPNPDVAASSYHDGSSYNFTAAAFTGGEKTFYAHWSVERYHVVLQFDENLPDGYELYSNPGGSEFYPDRDWDLDSLDSSEYVWTDRAFPFEARTADHSLYRQHLGWSFDPNSTTAEYGFNEHVPANVFTATNLTRTLYAVWSDPTPQKKVTYYWLTDQYDTSTVTSVEINMDNLWDSRFNPSQASGAAGEPGMIHRRPGVLGIYEIPDGETYNPHESPSVLDIRNFKEIHPEQESFDLQFWCQQNWYNSGHPTTDKRIGVVYLELDHIEVIEKPNTLVYDLSDTFDDVSGLKIKRYWKRTTWTDTYEYGDSSSEYHYPGDFIFIPALNSTLPSTPQTVDVEVKFNPSSSTIYLTPPYTSTNGGFKISIGNNRLTLKLMPSDKGTFNDTGSNEIVFVTASDFNNFKTNIVDEITVADNYQYINKWSDGTNNNINISEYNWNGTNSFELTTNLSPLLSFVINDSDAAKGSITSTKTIFNNTDRTVFLNNGVSVQANTNYHFLGWVKEGTDTVVSLDEVLWNEFITNNTPMKMVAKFADVITYRLVYNTTAPSGFVYNGPELQEVTRTSFDGTFDTPITITDLIDTDFYIFSDYYGYARKRRFKQFYSGSNTFNPGDQITEAGTLFGSSHTLTLRLEYEEFEFASNMELKKYEDGSVQTTKIYYDDPNAENLFLSFMDSIDYDNFVNNGSEIYAYNCFYTNYNHYSSHQYKWNELDQDINTHAGDKKTKEDITTHFYDWHTQPDDHHTYEYGVNYRYLKENGVTIVTSPTTTYDIGETASATGLVVKFEYWNHSNENFSYDEVPEIFRFDPELSSFGYNIVHDEPVSVYVKNYTNDVLKLYITVDASGEGAYLLLNHGATFDNGGAAIKYDTAEAFNNAKAAGVNINVEDGYQNLNRWTSDGTTYHDSLNYFDWDGTGSIIIRNNISTTVSFNCDTEKGSIASQKLVFNDEEGDLFDAADFSVTPTIRWVFNGYKKNDGADLIQVADIDWANSYDADAPVVYTADFSYKTINTIDVLTKPSKITYIEGDNFNPSGLVIKATYADGENETVIYNNSVDDFETITTTLLPGVDVARMKFLNKEFTIPITVNRKKASSISINTKPTKLAYKKGEKLDVTGLVINVVYNNDTRGTIAYSGNESQFSFNPDLTQELITLNKYVEVTYDDCKTRFDITVTEDKPTPTPTPTPTPIPSYSGGSSGGGGGSSAIPGPLAKDYLPANISINTIKTITAVLDSNNSHWQYDLVNNKWKLESKGTSGETINVQNGFYVLTHTTNEIINNVTTPIATNNTYYFDTTGNMHTGWVHTIDNKVYFFENLKIATEGAMVIGWKEIQDSWYYFGSDGAMYVNTTTPDGYLVGADGKYIK